ncbi:MAG: signal peptidase II, partial [Planctomycetota bacterium]|nr:signal peptidase II [Planctomycetota bacterium]
PTPAAIACPTSARAGKAFRSPRAFTLCLLALVIGLGGDLASKHYVFQRLLADPDATRTAVGTYLAYKAQGRTLETRDLLGCFTTGRVLGVGFKLQTNKGVVFGTELHPSQTVHRLIVACVSVVLVGMVVLFFASSEALAWMAHLALGAVLAGALGNLYDRLWGSVEIPPMAPAQCQVRDFIDCSALGYPWVFNVADVLLVVGVGVLAIHWYVGSRKANRKG